MSIKYNYMMPIATQYGTDFIRFTSNEHLTLS